MLSNSWYVRGWEEYDSEARGRRWHVATENGTVKDWPAKESHTEGVRSLEYTRLLYNVVYSMNVRNVKNEVIPVRRRMRPTCNSSILLIKAYIL